MLGAHFDSLARRDGAADNAAGCAVVLEAIRILRVLRLETRRTVRLALWTGSSKGCSDRGRTWRGISPIRPSCS